MTNELSPALPEADNMPPMPREGELSVRAKATEQRPGVYVTQMGVRPIRIGKGEATAQNAARWREHLGGIAIDTEVKE